MTNEKFDDQLKALSERVLSNALDDDERNAYTESLFESIRHINEYGQEYWCARELQVALEYTEWRNFKKVIDRAIIACEGSKNATLDHFVEVSKMVNTGSGAGREIDDYHLSRYACYLIVQNSDPRKKVIALGQTYFAVKTRQQELIEHYDDLTEDQKRLAIRQEMKEHNKQLVAAAKDAGVETSLDYAIFQNYGYQGLYGGLKVRNWRRICSVLRRPRLNCAGRMYRGKIMLTRRIMRSARKSAIRSSGSAVRCPRICRHLIKASSSWRRNNARGLRSKFVYAIQWFSLNGLYPTACTRGDRIRTCGLLVPNQAL